VFPAAIVSGFVVLDVVFVFGRHGELVGLVALLVVIKLAMILQSELGRRLYHRGEMRLIAEVGAVLPSWPMCQRCGMSTSSSKTCCPLCGTELGTAAAVAPLVCPECGEHLRFEEVCCPGCRSSMGIKMGA
jgi:hypothetical protein